jgi:hypothetical protein
MLLLQICLTESGISVARLNEPPAKSAAATLIMKPTETARRRTLLALQTSLLQVSACKRAIGAPVQQIVVPIESGG